MLVSLCQGVIAYLGLRFSVFGKLVDSGLLSHCLATLIL